MADQLTLTQLLAHIRALTKDRDSAISDSDLVLLVNEAGAWYHANFTDRFTRHSHDSAFNNQTGFTAGLFTKDTNVSRYLALLSASLEVAFGNRDGSAPLERVEPHELYRMRLKSTAPGTPRFWTAWRKVDDTFRVLIHPPAIATRFVSFYVELDWADMDATTDASNAMDVNAEDAYLIGRIAAVQAASILERSSQEIQAIESMLPRHITSRMGVIERTLGPRPPTEHAA